MVKKNHENEACTQKRLLSQKYIWAHIIHQLSQLGRCITSSYMSRHKAELRLGSLLNSAQSY